ncbi:MAG: penicillin-binding protein activator [Thermodesulfobacteriota bacterium]
MLEKMRQFLRTTWVIAWIALIGFGCAPPPKVAIPDRPALERPTPKPPAPAPKPADMGDDLFEAAEMSFRQKDYDKALEAYTAYLNRYPAGSWVADSLLKVGLIHREKGRLSQALSAFQKLSLDFPNSALAASAEVASFPIYFQMKNYGGIIQRAGNILKQRLSPDVYRETIDWLAKAYDASGKPGDALLTYAQAIPTVDAATRTQFQEQFETIAARTDPDELMRLLNRTGLPDIQGDLLYHAAGGYVQKEAFDKALAAIDRFKRDFPNHARRARIDELALQISRQSEFAKHTIGVILPLTGTYEAYGKRALRGVELAQYAFTSSRPSDSVTVLIQDNQSTPEGSIAAVRELGEARAAAILGPIGSAESAAEAAQSAGIPILTLTQKEKITQIGNQVFRHFITPEMQAQRLVDYAVKSRRLNRFAVLYPKEPYGTSMTKAFVEKVEAAGGTVIGVESYDPVAADYAAPIQKLTGISTNGDTQAQQDTAAPRNDIDVLFLPESPTKTGRILAQLNFYNLKPRLILGTNLWHTSAARALAASIDSELVFTDAFDPDSDAEQARRFSNMCMELYNEKPGLVEAITYDSALMLFETVTRPDIRYRSDIRSQLLAIPGRNGITGKTRFAPNRDCIKELLLFRILQDRILDITGF